MTSKQESQESQESQRAFPLATYFPPLPRESCKSTGKSLLGLDVGEASKGLPGIEDKDN